MRKRMFCKDLVFKYPFHNRLHVPLERVRDHARSKNDTRGQGLIARAADRILPIEWYVDDKSNLPLGWGKSPAEAVVEGAKARSVAQIRRNGDQVAMAQQQVGRERAAVERAETAKAQFQQQAQQVSLRMDAVYSESDRLDRTIAAYDSQIEEQQALGKRLAGDGNAAIAEERASEVRVAEDRLHAAQEAQAAVLDHQAKLIHDFKTHMQGFYPAAGDVLRAKQNEKVARVSLKQAIQRQRKDEQKRRDAAEGRRFDRKTGGIVRADAEDGEQFPWDPMQHRPVQLELDLATV